MKAEQTILLSYSKDFGRTMGTIVSPTPESIKLLSIPKDRVYTLTLSLAIDKKAMKVGDTFHWFAVDITNDPTLLKAGDFVSLGYHLLRFYLKNVTIKSLNPFTLSTNTLLNLSIRFGRPPRRPKHVKYWGAVQDQSSMISFQTDIDQSRHFIFPENHFGRIAMVCSERMKTEAHTWVEIIDFRSYYSPVEIHDMMQLKGDSIINQGKYHSELVNRYIEQIRGAEIGRTDKQTKDKRSIRPGKD